MTTMTEPTDTHALAEQLAAIATNHNDPAALENARARLTAQMGTSGCGPIEAACQLIEAGGADDHATIAAAVRMTEVEK